CLELAALAFSASGFGDRLGCARGRSCSDSLEMVGHGSCVALGGCWGGIDGPEARITSPAFSWNGNSIRDPPRRPPAFLSHASSSPGSRREYARGPALPAERG